MTLIVKVTNRDSSRVYLMSLMTPLIQAPSIIPQLTLSSCTILNTMCNKHFEIMTHFNGDKIRPILIVNMEAKPSHGYLILELL